MAEPPPQPPSARRPRDGRFIVRVLIAVGIALGGIALALLLWYGVRVLMIGFAGVLLGVLLRACAVAVGRWTKLGPGWGLAIALVAIVGLFVGVGFLLAPDVVEQAGQLTERLPKSWESLKGRISQYGWGKQALALLQQTNPMNGGAGGAAPTTQAVKQATGIVTSTLSVLVDVLVILFLGIYFAIQPGLYVDGLADLFPPSMRRRICEVLNQVGETLRLWLIAQGIDMVVIGVLTWLGLWFLGIPLALTLALLAALFNFIPNFGPLISYVPAVLLALAAGGDKALYVTILYVVLQSVEGYILLPLLQRNAVDTPPALLIAGQVLLTLLVGGIGLALAAPLMAVVIVVTKMLYQHDVLGDPVELPTKHEPPRPGGPALQG